MSTALTQIPAKSSTNTNFSPKSSANGSSDNSITSDQLFTGAIQFAGVASCMSALLKILAALLKVSQEELVMQVNSLQNSYKGSSAMASASQSSIEKQAESTEDQAMGSFISGGATLGSGFTSLGVSTLYGRSDVNEADSNVKFGDDLQSKVDETIQSPDDSEFVMSEGETTEEFAARKEKAKSLAKDLMDKDGFNTPEIKKLMEAKDKSALDDAVKYAHAHPEEFGFETGEGNKALTKLRNRAEDFKDKSNNKRDKVNSDRSRFSQMAQMFGQGASAFGDGFGKTESASAQNQQAKQEAIQKFAQFSSSAADESSRAADKAKDGATNQASQILQDIDKAVQNNTFR